MLIKSRGGANGRYYIMTLKRWMNLWEIGARQAWPEVLIDELAQNSSKSEIGATLGDGLYCQLL